MENICIIRYADFYKTEKAKYRIWSGTKHGINKWAVWAHTPVCLLNQLILKVELWEKDEIRGINLFKESFYKHLQDDATLL